MVTWKQLEKQLKKIGFNPYGWGRSEAKELCNVLAEDELIEECVNGYYEAGFALLVATKDRLVLVDKKPLNYLTIEDMRFDMINEFDYSHRLFGAHVTISSGSKTFQFTTVNQPRLRRLVNFVQGHMSKVKHEQKEHQETQQRHLEEMNEQLRLYLAAAQQQTQQQTLAVQRQEVTQQQQMATLQTLAQPAGAAVPASVPPVSAFERAAANIIGAALPIEANGEPASPARAGRAVRIGRHILHFMIGMPRNSLQHASQVVVTPQQVGLSAARRVVPVISAYSRLPIMSNRRRYGRQDGARGTA
jgi:hypothetical protein